jgi:hypothetical protein
MNIKRKLLALAIASFGIAVDARASTVWNEAVNGDLSNDGLAPTLLIFALGDNAVLGSTGQAGQPGGDRDYFTFTVAPGTVLTSISLLANTFVSGSASFLAIQAGPQLTVTPTGGGAQNLLGFVHYDTSQIGSNLLPIMGIPGALPSGAYSVWVQELGGTVDYGLNFNVAAVPLPGAAVLLVSGLLGLTTLRRRSNS